MGITFPYIFKDGDRAFAAHLMANFNALSTNLNGLTVDGLPDSDLQTVLNQLKGLIDGLTAGLAATVTAGETGNAGQIVFTDGETFQGKLDNNTLKGQDGQCFFDQMYYFRVDQSNGHLYVGVPDGAPQPPLSIDSNGHLIYTIA